MQTNVSGWKVASLGAVWGGAVLLVLQAHRLPGNFSHSICGVWGCGPPVQALIAMHGFWLVLLSLPVGLCCRFMTANRLLAVSVLALALGLAGIAGVVVWQAEYWLPNASELQREYFLERCLFAVGTMTDIPVIQMALAGLVGIVTAWWKRPQGADADTTNGETVRRFEQIPTRQLLTTSRQSE